MHVKGFAHPTWYRVSCCALVAILGCSAEPAPSQGQSGQSSPAKLATNSTASSSCDYRNPCLVVRLDPDVGCVYAPVDDGTSCAGGSCLAGVCRSPDCDD